MNGFTRIGLLTFNLYKPQKVQRTPNPLKGAFAYPLSHKDAACRVWKIIFLPQRAQRAQRDLCDTVDHWLPTVDLYLFAPFALSAVKKILLFAVCFSNTACHVSTAQLTLLQGGNARRIKQIICGDCATCVICVPPHPFTRSWFFATKSFQLLYGRSDTGLPNCK